MAQIRVRNAEDARTYVDNIIEKHRVVVFSKSWCPYCTRAKDLLKEFHVEIFILELDELDGDEGNLIQSELQKKTKQRTVPNIFINRKHIGGCDDTMKLHKQGKLVGLINTNKT